MIKINFIKKSNNFNIYLGRERSSRTGYHPAAVLEVGAMMLQNMFSALSFLHYRKDDDFVDRLSYFYTPSFLIMMAILVSFKQVRYYLTLSISKNIRKRES